jgi:hypothetical protein
MLLDERFAVTPQTATAQLRVQVSRSRVPILSIGSLPSAGPMTRFFVADVPVSRAVFDIGSTQPFSDGVAEAHGRRWVALLVGGSGELDERLLSALPRGVVGTDELLALVGPADRDQVDPGIDDHPEGAPSLLDPASHTAVSALASHGDIVPRTQSGTR